MCYVEISRLLITLFCKCMSMAFAIDVTKPCLLTHIQCNTIAWRCHMQLLCTSRNVNALVIDSCVMNLCLYVCVCVCAVSYTPLGVYKRQLIFLFSYYLFALSFIFSHRDYFGVPQYWVFPSFLSLQLISYLLITFLCLYNSLI